MAYSKEYQRQYYLKNMERIRQYQSQYYLRNKERLRQYDQQYYSENKAKINQYQEQYRHHHPERKIRQRLMQKAKRKATYEQLLQIYGNKCACCGESNRLFLTLDHINGGGYAERKALKNYPFRCVGKATREPDRSKYQILCFNCNCGKNRNNGICPHKS